MAGSYDGGEHGGGGHGGSEEGAAPHSGGSEIVLNLGSIDVKGASNGY